MHFRKLKIRKHLQRDTFISYMENRKIARRIWIIFLDKNLKNYSINFAFKIS